jgi:ricin-type beta-trefoil lectin protein/putative Ig domain-containing protein
LRSKLYATVGVCLAVAAFTLPGLAHSGPAAAATPSSAFANAPLSATTTAPSLNLPKQSAGAHECAAPTSPLMMQCQSIVATSPKARAAANAAAKAAISARAKGESPAVSSAESLEPADLQAAYGITSASASGGLGETVAVVDAFYDPNAQTDLRNYRSDFGLLACGQDTAAPQAGCLNVYNQNGANLATDPAAAPPPSTIADDWDQETSLDIEMVSAICPNCTIDLIEANSESMPDLGKAEDTAVSLGAKFVSDSWNNLLDFPGESANDKYFNHPGVAITVASGDYGYDAAYPASSQFVTSVGGTFLDQNSSGDWTSTVWNDNGTGNMPGGTGNLDDIPGTTASGCSAGEPQPSWGLDSTDNTSTTLCANRTENDVSAVADAPHGVDVLDTNSLDSGLCSPFCDTYGTSVATPIIAAMYALARTPAANTYPASYLYANPSDLTHVTSGLDGTCESTRQYLCNAGQSLTSGYVGYNGPAGLGTPNGNLTPFTETKTDVVSIANPGTTDVQQGASVSLPIKAIDSAGHTLTYTAALPAGLTINSATGVISGKAAFVENDTVRVTATDGTASASVYFRLPSSASLTADYHAGTGLVELDWASKCLGDSGNSSANGAKVIIYQCASNNAGEIWSFQPSTAPGEVANAGLSQLGSILIHGKCLSTSSNSAANGAKLQLWACNGATSQLWEITGTAGALYNPTSGRCINDPNNSTANGTQLVIWTCTGAATQDWLLPGSPFESAVAGKCINDSGNSTANGAAIISYTCNGASNEKLLVESAGPYALLLVNGKCLNAVGNGTVNGTVVQLFGCANASNEVFTANLWYLTAYGQLENAQAQKCLAIPSNSTTNGTRLVLEDCYGEPGEIWSAS